MRYDCDIHALGVRIEQDLRIAAFELAQHAGDFLVERDFPFPVIGSLAKHERFDDRPQNVRSEFRMRYHDRLT